MALNRRLLNYAAQRHGMLKSAVVPPPDPSAGGAPPGGAPMDPAMGGMPPGMPPGMPMDPSMGGMPPGAPPGGMPMDPSMGGGAPPPPPPPPDPAAGGGGGGDLGAVVQMAMTNALSQAGLAGGGAAGKNGKPQAKVDINTIATDVFQLKKMVFMVFQRMGLELPNDILDGPNRDPATGAPAASSDGGSVVPPGSSMQDAAGGAGGPAPQSAIKPLEPMQGAFPTPGGGGGEAKSASSIGVPFSSYQGSPAEHARAVQRMFQLRR